MKWICMLCLALCCAPALAQITLADSVNIRRNRLSQTSSLVMTGWAVANIGSGLIGKANSTGAERYFHKTNFVFGLVDLFVAQVGYWGNRLMAGQRLSLAQTFKQQEKAEKLFLFNTGFDVAYVGLGIYLIEKGKTKSGDDRDRFRGRGQSILVNGAFLLAFDGILYLLHNRNGNRLDPYLQRLTVGPTPGGLGLVYRF